MYKFTRDSFGPLNTVPLHLDLVFDVNVDRTRVIASTTFVHRGTEPLSLLSLNCKDLDVREVYGVASSVPLGDTKAFPAHVSGFGAVTPLTFEVDGTSDLLRVAFGSPIATGQEFVVRTVSVATPTDHILEGIYYDFTPAGSPRTMITQCQQYGFQRIVPSIDTMNAKAFYTTTIIADGRYTNLISNGDLAPGYFDPLTSKPIRRRAAEVPELNLPADDDRVVVKYNIHSVKMAPYLFFLGVGTYETYVRRLEYPDGDTFNLELLLFPGLVKPEHAVVSLNALHDSVMWTYLSTGPESTLHATEREEVYRLVVEREVLKAGLYGPLVRRVSGPLSAEAEGGGPPSADGLSRLAEIRSRLAELMGAWENTGYKFTSQVYREIAMENSDYGGMENLHCTTIISSRIAPDDELVDGAYIYMEAVKVHEFYHNINGSQVTGQSPFEIWLNEAVTVYIERKRVDALFGADFMRLRTVLSAFLTVSGALAEDASPIAMPVEPVGFNRTQELISSMTYSKAPEFVRMVELVIGQAAFDRGLHAYHTKYAFGNATTEDWVVCMEEAGGVSLRAMADGWLKRTGYPHVTYTLTYDQATGVATLHFRQSAVGVQTGVDAAPWVIPIQWALVKDGVDTHQGVFTLPDREGTLTVSGVSIKPDFASIARGWSFYGTVASADEDQSFLEAQALSDPDVVNRYFAFRTIANTEKVAIVRALASGAGVPAVSPTYVALFSRILFDDTITPSSRALILAESDSLSGHHPALTFRYQDIHVAKCALQQAAFHAHSAQIISMFVRLNDTNVPGPHLNQLHDRSLKGLLATLIASAVFRPTVLPTATSYDEGTKAGLKAEFRRLLASSFMTDKALGFKLCMECESDPVAKTALYEAVKATWCKHPTTTETFISIVSALDAADTPLLIKQLLEDTAVFNINLAGHARSVARSFAGLRRVSLLTDAGLELTTDLVVRIAKVNQMSAGALLAAFGDIALFPVGEEFGVLSRNRLVAALQAALGSLDAVQQQSTVNNIRMLLG